MNNSHGDTSIRVFDFHKPPEPLIAVIHKSFIGIQSIRRQDKSGLALGFTGSRMSIYADQGRQLLSNVAVHSQARN